MKIAIIGASGNVGSKILEEAVSRDHRVTAIARNVDRVAEKSTVTVKQGDIGDPDGLAKVLAGHDVVVSSARFLSFKPADLIAAVKKAGVKRLLVVGGAGSLEVAPGAALVDTPNFPEAYKSEALAGRECLNVLRAEKELDWTFLSPSALFAPGERTGRFRLGRDSLLTAADGKSYISYPDYAVAMLDEIEKPAHSRQRFTVGY